MNIGRTISACTSSVLNLHQPSLPRSTLCSSSDQQGMMTPTNQPDVFLFRLYLTVISHFYSILMFFSWLSQSDMWLSINPYSRGKGYYICNFGKVGVHAIKHIYFLKVSAGLVKSWETVTTMKYFSAFLDLRTYKNWAHKISSLEYLTIYRSVLPVLPEHRVPHFFSPSWAPSGVLEASSCSSTWFNPCRGLDGKHPQQVLICG